MKTIFNEEMVNLLLSLSMIKFQDTEYSIYSMRNIRNEMDEKEIESWQKLIRVLTHEIMNSIAPITSISSSLSSIINKSTESFSEKTASSTLNGLKVIEERGEGLIRFVESYRTLTKVPEPEISLLQTNRIFESVQMLSEKRLSENGCKLQIYAKNNYSFYADESMMIQILLNLIYNSCEACIEVSNPEITIYPQQIEGKGFSIIVRDNGKGISEDELDKVFIPFYTTRENGSGIGLSLCKQLIRKQNGDIRIKSTQGKGTSVMLLFG